MNNVEMEQYLAERRADRRQRWVAIGLALAVILALPASFAAPYVLGNNVVGDGTFSSSIASGSNAFGVTTNGAYIDFGAGANDRCASNGTVVTCDSQWTLASLFVTSGASFPSSATGANRLNISSTGVAQWINSSDVLGVQVSNGGISTNTLDITTSGGVGGASNWFAGTPTVTACTSPSITHGTATSFQMDVGTICAAVTTVTITLPAATNGWHCRGDGPTSNRNIKQLAPGSTTQVVLTNVSDTLGTAAPWVDGDDLVISCTAR